MEVVRSRLQKFCDRVAQRDAIPCAELVEKIVVRVGDPVDEIIKASTEEACDLIVLGDHSRGFLAQALLGSVSRAVLGKTRKPVYLIPLPSEETFAWDEI